MLANIGPTTLDVPQLTLVGNPTAMVLESPLQVILVLVTFAQKYVYMYEAPCMSVGEGATKLTERRFDVLLAPNVKLRRPDPVNKVTACTGVKELY